jgi:hypothetical protein
MSTPRDIVARVLILDTRYIVVRVRILLYMCVSEAERDEHA